MTSWEAMAIGTPVLMAVDEQLDRLVHDEPVPVLNASTIEEIEDQLLRATDAAELERVAARVAAWTRTHHADAYLDRYLLYAAAATGDPALLR